MFETYWDYRYTIDCWMSTTHFSLVKNAQSIRKRVYKTLDESSIASWMTNEYFSKLSTWWYMYLDYHHWINDLDNFPLNLDRNYQRIGENLFRFYQSRVMVNVKIHIEISHGKTHIFPKSIWLLTQSRNLHTPPLRSQHCPLGRLRDSCLKTPRWGVGIHNFCGGFWRENHGKSH